MTLSFRYFVRIASTGQASRLIGNQKPGTFLVRYSISKHSLAIRFKTETENRELPIKLLSVGFTPPVFQCEDRNFGSLEELITWLGLTNKPIDSVVFQRVMRY